MVKRRYDRLSSGVDLDDQLGHIQKQTKVHKQTGDAIMTDLRKAYPSMDDSELHKMLEWGKDEGLELLSSIGKLLGVGVGGAASAGIGYMIGLSASNPAATAALLFLAGGKVYGGVVKAEMAIQNLGSKIYTGLFRSGLSRETGFADSFAKFWGKNMKINKFTAAEAYQSTGGVELKGGLTRNDYMKGHDLYEPGSVINRVKRIYRRFKETTEERISREASEADSDLVASQYDEILTDNFEMSNNNAEARVAKTLAGNPREDLTPADIEYIEAVEKKWKRPIFEIDDSVIDSRYTPDKDPGKYIHEDFKVAPPKQTPVPPASAAEPIPEPVGPVDEGVGLGFDPDPEIPGVPEGLADEYVKWKKTSVIPESVDIPALSEELNIDPEILVSLAEEGGVEGQSVLGFLNEFGSHANLTVGGPASVAMFIYSVYSGAEQWKQMDKTRAALASTLSKTKPGDPGYYDMRTALKHIDETNAISKALVVGNATAGLASAVSVTVGGLAASGLIAIGPEMAAAAASMGIFGLALGAVLSVAALALIVGPGVADAARMADDALDRQSGNPSGFWMAGEKDEWRADQSRLVSILRANPMTKDMGDIYAAMRVEKFRQQYTPKWELMAPIFASINNFPESWGYKDAKEAQTALILHRREWWNGKIMDDATFRREDPDTQDGDSNASRWGGFIGKSQRKRLDMIDAKNFHGNKDMRNPAYVVWLEQQEKNGVWYDDPTLHYVHGKWVHVDPVVLGGAKNSDELNRINDHHRLAEKYAAPKEKMISTGDDPGIPVIDNSNAPSGDWNYYGGVQGGYGAEHPSIERDIPFDMPVDKSTGRHAKDGQGAGVVEVGKNYDKAHAAGQKGTDLSLSLHKPNVVTGDNWNYEDKRFANWTTTNPNNHIVESHGHAEANRIWTTPSNAAPKGINQPGNPKPHHGESIIAGSTETGKPGSGLFTSHDPDLPYGSFPVRHWGNATEAPADDPSHMVEAGGSQNPFRGSNPPTHSGARSGITLGDLRVMHALNRSVLNQEPMAIAAKKNFMHSLGERAAFD